MANFVALEMPLGKPLVQAIRRCLDAEWAFCVLDPNQSNLRRTEALAALRPTHIWSDEATPTPLANGRTLREGDGAVVFTSGSSGAPKAAVLTWEALRQSATLTSTALARESQPTWLAALPPTHIGGLAVLLRCVLGPAELLFDHDVADGAEFGATHVAVVRTQLARYDTSAYECVLLGGGPAPNSVASNVVTTWGMTETGSGVLYDGTPLPGVRVAVLDGELLVASPTLFSRYLDSDRPSVTHEGYLDWFPTGDGASLHDGVVSIHGRLGYVINTGGEKVWPEDLERLFTEVEGVNDVAVVGRDDDEWGQRIVACVVTDEDDATILDRLRAVAREHVGRWAQPKSIERVAVIPRTANGKINRSAL